MEEAGRSVEYLCYSCGSEGLVMVPESLDVEQPDGKALHCPSCGRIVGAIVTRKKNDKRNERASEAAV